MPSNYRLFISHAWRYGDQYDKLVSLLEADPYFHYSNYSIPKDDPVHNTPYEHQLYEAIKNKIQGTHIVVILAGVYATYSKWINKEIKIAKTEFLTPKPIVAIEPWDSEKASKLVKENADVLVKWNTKSIVSGIRSVVN